MRILYVEDNATNVILVQRVANMGKHEVINYDNGQDALDKFDEIKPDLILLDVQLRGPLTGLDVARILRERSCQLPILAVTAYAMKGDRQRCLDAGCDDYLPKPISVAELVTVFKRYGDAVTSGKPILSTYKPSPVVGAAAPDNPAAPQPNIEIVPVSVPVEAAPAVEAVPAAAPVAVVVSLVETPAVTTPPIEPVAQQTPTPINVEP